MEPVEKNETRKLAAVMFADIVGHTALFQRNEAAGMRQVNEHRQDLESLAARHNGTIIQFYGDGSVTIYDSVIDALRCASALQQRSTDHRIPVRIGLHIGDLVIKDKDIYGDVVNVASRIQSLGIPGSVLLSKKVVDELGNHPEFNTTRLGAFKLKNVHEEMEIYALKGAGLTTPVLHQTLAEKAKHFPRLYFWMAGTIMLLVAGFFAFMQFRKAPQVDKDVRTCISTFRNLSGDTTLDGIKETASSYITSYLSKKSESNVVKYMTRRGIITEEVASLKDIFNQARKTKADIVVTGDFDIIGRNRDSLIFLVQLLDTETEQPLPHHIPDVYCARQGYWDCIKEVATYVSGFWRSRDENLFRPTKDEAYELYHKAQNLWADPKTKKDVKQYLQEAIRIDTSFLDAYTLLALHFNNEKLFQQEADTLALIQRRFPDLDTRESNYLSYLEADLGGHNREAASYLQRELAHDPDDLFLKTDALVLAIEYLNDPKAASLIADSIALDELDLLQCAYCRTTVNMAIQAYGGIHQNEKAIRYADLLDKYVTRPGQVNPLLNVYIQSGDTSKVTTLINRTSEGDRKPRNRKAYNYYKAANCAAINKDNSLRDFYAGQVIGLYKDTIHWQAGWAHYLRGEYDKALRIYQAEIKKTMEKNNHPDVKYLLADLGLVYASLKDTIQATGIVQSLASMKADYDFGEIPYLQARIMANLGDEAAAVRYLRTSLEQGKKFQAASSFQHDPALIILHGKAGFEEVLKMMQMQN